MSSYSSSSSSSRSSSSRSSSSVSHSLSSSSLSSSSSSSISFSSSSRSSSSSSYSISSSSSSSSSSSYASVALEYYETASSGLKKLDDTNPTSSTLDTESSFANGIYYDVGWEDSRWEEDNAYGIDLGESKDVDTLRIYINLEGSPHDLFGTYDAWDPDENGTLSAYYSNDNSSWTLISSKDCNSENFPLRQYNVEGVASFDFIFSSTISARYFKLVNTGSYELKFMDSGSFLSCSARCAGEIVAGYKTSPSEAPGALDEFSTVKWDADFGMEDVRFYPEHEYKTVTIGEE